MANRLKHAFYTLCWYLGLFHLTKQLYKDKLQILCYHGFESHDESEFRPKLFIKMTTFRRRMFLLKKHGFKVLSLNNALTELDGEGFSENTVVITIDDGFFNVLELANPVFAEFEFPYTLYLTTYYVKKNSPVYGLVIQYMFWKSSKYEIDFSDFEFLGKHAKTQNISCFQTREKMVNLFIEYGDESLNENGRVALSNRLGSILSVDYNNIVTSKILSLLSLSEAIELRGRGADLQLHTHRHVLPNNNMAISREISDNRDVLAEIVDYEAVHFCYPSGVWSKDDWPALASENIISATTCMAGVNGKNNPKLGLCRFLDGENISEIEYLAELYCFAELLRNIRGKLKLILGKP